ncbi:calcium-activated chloride channel-domain-containing protein [Obelidium mucronatum]|nr:calcium-activated chloride channel-domain-containing protein [Obelidium mucronatum]
MEEDSVYDFRMLGSPQSRIPVPVPGAGSGWIVEEECKRHAGTLGAGSQSKAALVVAGAAPLLQALTRRQEAVEGAAHVGPLTAADELRLLHGFVTAARYYGGAGVLVAEDLACANAPVLNNDWKWVGGKGVVDAVLALHDKDFEKKWIEAWSDKWVLDTKDISEIREHMGEQVGYYFAFVQFYVQALMPLSIFGVIAYLLFPAYSYTYSFVLCLWGIFFMVAWKRQEKYLADLWGSTSSDRVDTERPEFIPDRLDVDPKTNECVPYYPFWKRWIIHAGYTVPVIIVFGTAVTIVSFVIVLAEVFTAEVYQGPDKWLVKMLPILIYVLCLPLLQALYMKLSSWITKLENSQSVDSHTASFSRKAFIITCLLTQLSLFLTGVVYIPISDLLVPYVNPVLEQYGVSHHVVGLNATETRNLLSPSSLQTKVISFSITNQIINQAVQVLIPAILAWWSTSTITKAELKDIEDERKEKATAADGAKKTSSAAPTGDIAFDASNEPILSAEETMRLRIEKALVLPVYDQYDEYAELANQFALLIMFSASWPLVPLFCFINNFLDLRTHAFKVCRTVRRPIPHRTNSIKPWTSIFASFSILGTMTTVLLTLLYKNWDNETPAHMQSIPKLATYFIILVCVEHLQFFTSWVVSVAMSIVWGDLKALGERKRRFERQVETFVKTTVGEVEDAVEGRVESVLEKLKAAFGQKHAKKEE